GPNPPASGGDSSTDIGNQPVPLGASDARSSASLASLLLSAFALVNTMTLLAGALMRRKRESIAGKRKGNGALKALAIIAGIATPIIWVMFDWPFANLTFVNESSLYVAVAFVATIGLTLAYNLSKTGRAGKVAEQA
ncbi:MAG: hypothetical protein LBC58_02590, partial [Clostridiales Family XIII bacterium]|nr:hypothetical protein [Clostridiales Family XIII bacterium]